MRKIILLLLCCGVLVSMVGCGGNTAPPPTGSSQTTLSETAITKTAPVTVVESTEKETVTIESKEQTSEPTPTTPTATVKSTETIKPSETTNTSEEKVDLLVRETVASTTSQHTEMETTTTEPIKEIVSEPETIPSEFDIHYWITFAKEYAASVGLTLDSTAVDCWDNPIRAGAHCIYLERDIQNRLNIYAKDEDITDVWIWAEHLGNDCYDIYVGYA